MTSRFLKSARWSLLALATLLLTAALPAQSVDAFLGFNTVITKTPPDGIPKFGTGLFPTVGGDLMFLPHGLGLGGQVAWRGSQTDYFGEGVRPILFDFNLVWQPVPPGQKIRPDIAVGIGATSLRFYTGQYSCSTFTGCTDYLSSNHAMLHASVGLKIYLTDHIFLRPGVDFYNIRHNIEFGVPTAWQAGVAIGYTLGPSS